MTTHAQQVADQIATLRAHIRDIPLTVETDDTAELRQQYRRGDFDSEQDVDWLSAAACDRDERGAA